ncbi:hypothetical protein BCR41DRAFT_401161 [Lobosporangium transversale]|uniref:Uncharacterized protein n=1 Tax=Lobosporangium transversale TaxID=64571 RepID=A0A1Y2G8N7_9FUNG|nr:hypothetical protein BCR41DRAFT_401161 [Lobosporangium transversale]ORZ04310.1 hypothetical protein BCR41DRAFT_401161 [Lobosporangium transversale]|eukprot:XP_021876468.1 hypothetical protein BCR41DRAFT_401161 [Lobosporangium transversale]
MPSKKSAALLEISVPTSDYKLRSSQDKCIKSLAKQLIRGMEVWSLEADTFPLRYLAAVNQDSKLLFNIVARREPFIKTPPRLPHNVKIRNTEITHSKQLYAATSKACKYSSDRIFCIKPYPVKSSKGSQTALVTAAVLTMINDTVIPEKRRLKLPKG